MKKMCSFKLKQSCIDELKQLSDEFDISQADVIEKLIDFLVITNYDFKQQRGVEIENIVYSSNVRNLLQSLR